MGADDEGGSRVEHDLEAMSVLGVAHVVEEGCSSVLELEISVLEASSSSAIISPLMLTSGRRSVSTEWISCGVPLMSRHRRTILCDVYT